MLPDLPGLNVEVMRPLASDLLELRVMWTRPDGQRAYVVNQVSGAELAQERMLVLRVSPLIQQILQGNEAAILDLAERYGVPCVVGHMARIDRRAALYGAQAAMANAIVRERGAEILDKMKPKEPPPPKPPEPPLRSRYEILMEDDDLEDVA